MHLYFDQFRSVELTPWTVHFVTKQPFQHGTLDFRFLIVYYVSGLGKWYILYQSHEAQNGGFRYGLEDGVASLDFCSTIDLLFNCIYIVFFEVSNFLWIC